MKSMPASSAILPSARQSGQLAVQRSGALVAVRDDEQFEPDQALRTELRPDQPEVDGILGAGAIRSAEIDVDYPHNRVLMRCSSDECTTRPAFAEVADCTQVRNCIGLL